LQPTDSKGGSLPLLLYGITIFFSAFLLFQVQPIIAKIILPWFGGSASVWTTCMLFFQVVLLAGYWYAHLSMRKLQPTSQAWLHIGLLAASVLLLHVMPNPSWKPQGNEDPGLRILGLLTVSIGAPYFLLSSTSPLLQAWYGRAGGGALPYRLFAVSNLGSLLGLLAYPVLIEPRMATRHQAQGWSAGYALFAIFCAAVALRSRRRHAASAVETASTDYESAPSWGMQLLWLGLAACASTFLLGATNHLTQNVASIPFLWILPLALYLLTFILCFEGRGWYSRRIFLGLAAVGLAGMAYTLSENFYNADLKLLVPLYAGGLFVCCMVCHGELARLKPDPRHLTSFYLMVSLGGALGGILVGLIAPHFFSGFFELPIAIASCCGLVLLVLCLDVPRWAPDLKPFWRPWIWGASVAITLGLCGYLGYNIREFRRGSLVLVRNFYGGLRVHDATGNDEHTMVRHLTHGTISHGSQILDPVRRRFPTTYYGTDTGVGRALAVVGREGSMHVGVIGLGAGTLAAYGRAGDSFRIYDINPAVIKIAYTSFTYLTDSKAHIEIPLGDARLSLEREPAENFDLLAVDAFSSDAIPVHLLTREAFGVYFHHLKETGVLAMHISNRHLDLEPVMDMAATAYGKKAIVIETEDDDPAEVSGATWVLLTNRPGFFEEPLISKGATPLKHTTRLRPWTDDYSNLFQILKK
jgi:hypothetical protein